MMETVKHSQNKKADTVMDCLWMSRLFI